ncbi:hypothetical protein [Paraburkholderia sp. SIMBA_030]|uniref:hypothetical protein n=1 Tax=Paraburkholderia sp. SIMBA_030 TaxID=3085773 RepID=UPI0039794F7B
MDDEEADEESEKRAKDSANRNLTALKTALNYAKKHGLLSTDIGWKEVNKHKQVGALREGWLHAEERKRLLDAMPDNLRTLSLAPCCASAHDPANWRTPTRPILTARRNTEPGRQDGAAQSQSVVCGAGALRRAD